MARHGTSARLRAIRRLGGAALLLAVGCGQPGIDNAAVQAVHQPAFAFDAHSDTPLHVLWAGHDLGRDAHFSQVDLPKMDQGGLDGALFGIPVIPDLVPQPRMAAFVVEAIDAFEAQVARYTDRIAIARTGADLDRLHAGGKKVVVFSIEGGHPIQNSLDTLRMLADRGVRSITLTHFVTNEWADPSQVNQSGMGDYFARIPKHGGLTDFGRDVVREMNRLGVVVDLSHASPETCMDAFDVTTEPVIFSHSGVRALCDHHRNVNDDVLLRLKDNGGVFCLTYVPQYLDASFQEPSAQIGRQVREEVGGVLGGLTVPRSGAAEYLRAILLEFAYDRIPMPSTEALADHIDYLVRLIGVDHVGLGSDWDGVWNRLADLRDASELPNVTRTLLRRGYGAEDIQKILGGNLVRVLRAAMP